MASHLRLHCLLNRLFRRKSKKTQSSASLAFVRRLHRWPVDSPYGFPLQRTRSAENISIWWHHSALCFHPGDRNVFGICSSSIVTSVKNVPKCLTLSTLGTHLVVFMSVIVHACHWYQAHNIMREIRWKAKAILPPNIKLIPDGTKTNSVGSSISKLYHFFQILV